MDIFMPMMNGIKATKAIRQHEAESNLDRTPVIIITGNYTKFDRMKSVDLDYDDFLCKPLDKDIIV